MMVGAKDIMEQAFILPPESESRIYMSLLYVERTVRQIFLHEQHKTAVTQKRKHETDV